MPTSDERRDRVARIALAIERAGGDHLGSTNTIHQDFLSLIGDQPTQQAMAVLRDTQRAERAEARVKELEVALRSALDGWSSHAGVPSTLAQIAEVRAVLDGGKP